MASGYGSFGCYGNGSATRPAQAPPTATAPPPFGGGMPPTAGGPPRSGGGASGSSGGPSLGTRVMQGPPPDRQPSLEKSILRSGASLDGKSAARAPTSRHSMWELALLPWVFVVLILVTYWEAGTYGFHHTYWAVPVILLPSAAWFIRHHYMRGNNEEVILGLLCMVGIVISLAVALYGCFAALDEYRALSQGASYFNVLPAEAAASKLDASTIVFTNTTLVDVTRTYGFTDTRDKAERTYCVAPVSDGDLYQQRIQYWATGIDCCEAMSNFACFRNRIQEGAHGALVVRKDAKHMERFHRAVQGALGAYDLTVGDHYLLVDWIEDPIGYRDGLWRGTTTVFAVFAISYLVISAMIGVAVLPAILGSPPM